MEVEFQHGSASDIPFPDNMFSFIVCTAAFKNFKEPLKALNQMYRVLTSGAALIIDMNRNVSNLQILVSTFILESKVRRFVSGLLFSYSHAMFSRV